MKYSTRTAARRAAQRGIEKGWFHWYRITPAAFKGFVVEMLGPNGEVWGIM